MEVISVIDSSTVERAYEILNDPQLLVIQDESERGILDEALLDHVQQEVDGQIFEIMKILALIPERAVRRRQRVCQYLHRDLQRIICTGLIPVI